MPLLKCRMDADEVRRDVDLPREGLLSLIACTGSAYINARNTIYGLMTEHDGVLAGLGLGHRFDRASFVVGRGSRV